MKNKRKTLQKLVGIGAFASVVPSSWIKPVISSVVLPAHAQTSEITLEVRIQLHERDILCNIYRLDDGGFENTEVDSDLISQPFEESIGVVGYINVDSFGNLNETEGCKVSVLVSPSFTASPDILESELSGTGKLEEFSVDILNSSNQIVKTVLVTFTYSE